MLACWVYGRERRSTKLLYITRKTGSVRREKKNYCCMLGLVYFGSMEIMKKQKNKKSPRYYLPSSIPLGKFLTGIEHGLLPAICISPINPGNTIFCTLSLPKHHSSWALGEHKSLRTYTL